MKIKVALFASAKELIGTGEVMVELSESATVAELKSVLAKSYPNLESIVSRSMVSVDLDYAQPDRQLTEKSEVALIPPVSGG